MRNKSLILAIIGIIVCILAGYLTFGKNNSGKLLSPVLNQVAKEKLSPTPTATPTPVVFNYDKSTNLNAELDSIKPEVKDSDFEDLGKIIPSL